MLHGEVFFLAWRRNMTAGPAVCAACMCTCTCVIFTHVLRVRIYQENGIINGELISSQQPANSLAVEKQARFTQQACQDPGI